VLDLECAGSGQCWADVARFDGVAGFSGGGRKADDITMSERGFATGFGLVAMALTLAIMAVLLLVGFNTLGAGSAEGARGAAPAKASIISQSSAETQIKLCAEGRDSSYGNPPSPAQQSKCLTELAGQISG